MWFGKKHNTTLLMFLLLMDGEQNPYSAFHSREGAARVAEPIMRGLVQNRYALVLQPPAVWNYDWSIVLCPQMTEEQALRFDFRNPETGEIDRNERFVDHCQMLRQLWKAQLCWRFPNLDHQTLTNALASSEAFFVQESRTVAFVMLLEDVIPQRMNRFTCGSMTLGEGIRWLL